MEDYNYKLSDSLYTLIRELFELQDDVELFDSMAFSDISGWDSLGWITLMNGIEKKYNFTIDLDEVANLKTIGQIRKFIE